MFLQDAEFMNKHSRKDYWAENILSNINLYGRRYTYLIIMTKNFCIVCVKLQSEFLTSIIFIIFKIYIIKVSNFKLFIIYLLVVNIFNMIYYFCRLFILNHLLFQVFIIFLFILFIIFLIQFFIF